MKELTVCFTEAAKHRLPSTAQASVWSTFHKLRRSKHVTDQWNSFVTSHLPSEESAEESHLGMQMLLDRMLKQLIKSEIGAPEVSTVICQPALDVMESNAVRYMAGYIAIKLLKKFRKATKNPRLQLKRCLFIGVLNGMKATNQPGDPDSPIEYTKVWTELRNRSRWSISHQ